MSDHSSFYDATEERDAATVGIVEAVSANILEILIAPEAPHGSGLREGTVQPFPRVNSYIVLPTERGSLLATVVWIGLTADNTTNSAPSSDHVGLPMARRRLRAIPLGVLTYGPWEADTGGRTARLDRGAIVFPTVGDPVRLPTPTELQAALPRTQSDVKLTIGTTPLVSDAKIQLDPNRLFGRHLAVLGNTGSGKSCSVVQLLRTSVLTQRDRLRGFNAVVLDLNGEYTDAFNDLPDGIRVRRFSAQPTCDEEKQFRVPYWLFNYQEWLSFSEASARAQAPQLRRCLQILKNSDVGSTPHGTVQLIGGRRIVQQFQAGAIPSNAIDVVLSELDNVVIACNELANSDSLSSDAISDIRDLRTPLIEMLEGRRGTGAFLWKRGVRRLSTAECRQLLPLFSTAIDTLGVPQPIEGSVAIDDSPVPFDAENLLHLLPMVAAETGADAIGWISPMVERLRIALSDERQRAICGSVPDENMKKWLKTYFPDKGANQVTLIDLSLVPSHVLHVLIAVFARAFRESMERFHRAADGTVPPRLLILEEAHSLIRRQSSSPSGDQMIGSSQLCREAFERIAREGRKFGISLIISSQRPSELSETVLSQCNTFMIHRLVNDRDQQLVQRLVPDRLGTLLNELPALPTQTALLVGWAVEIPTLVRVADLSRQYQPRSSDPDFVGTWKGDRRSEIRWRNVTDGWISPTAPVRSVRSDDASVDEYPDSPF